MGAKAPTPITVQLAPQCVQVPDLVEISAFVRPDCNGSSFIEHDSPAEPKMVAGAVELVENGPRVSVADTGAPERVGWGTPVFWGSPPL